MKNGLHIFVDASLDFRSKIIIDEYTKSNRCNEEICDALSRLKKHISEKNIEIYCDMVDNNQYEEVVKELMIKYYDPLYTHSSNKYDYDKKLMITSIDEGVEELKSFIDNLKCEE